MLHELDRVDMFFIFDVFWATLQDQNLEDHASVWFLSFCFGLLVAAFLAGMVCFKACCQLGKGIPDCDLSTYWGIAGETSAKLHVSKTCLKAHTEKEVMQFTVCQHVVLDRAICQKCAPKSAKSKD